MMYIQFGPQRGSWHILLTWTRVPGLGVTFCRRSADGETTEHSPAGKTCESCYREHARSLEPKPVDNDPVDEPVDNDVVAG